MLPAHSRVRSICLFNAALAALFLLLHGAPARAGLILDGDGTVVTGLFVAQPPNAQAYNLSTPSAEVLNSVLPYDNTVPLTATDGSPDLALTGSGVASQSAGYTLSGGAQVASSINTQNTAQTVTSGWRGLAEFEAVGYQAFTLTSSYNYKLVVHGSAAGDFEAYVEDFLNGPGGTVFDWSAVLQKPNVPVSQDATLTGTLGPGYYLFYFRDTTIAYSSTDPNYISSVSAEGTQTFTLTPTPEPASVTLLGLGALSLAGCGWRRRKQWVTA